jgi:hypothetical protein
MPASEDFEQLAPRFAACTGLWFLTVDVNSRGERSPATSPPVRLDWVGHEVDHRSCLDAPTV